jgi:hypothetical protein
MKKKTVGLSGLARPSNKDGPVILRGVGEREVRRTADGWSADGGRPGRNQGGESTGRRSPATRGDMRQPAIGETCGGAENPPATCVCWT